jgi:hypothetical protein
LFSGISTRPTPETFFSAKKTSESRQNVNHKWYWVIGLFLFWMLYSNGSLSGILGSPTAAKTS